MNKKRKIIFILGTGHCGSTLLDLLLGSHSQAFSLGEVFRVLHARPEKNLCDLCDEHCDIWTKSLIEKLQSTRNLNVFQKIWYKLNHNVSAELNFYNCIFKATNKDILIDSSKNPNWIKKNGLKLSNNGKYNLYLIYLSRDGRAVINSLYRKNPQRGIQYFINKWIHNIHKVNKCFENWQYGDKFQIKYNDLAQHPIKTITNILNRLDINFESDMMRFWEYNHHTINGNAGTKSLILKFKDKHRHNHIDWNKDKIAYYKNLDLGISLDERWKHELEQSHLEYINTAIFDLNKNII